MVRNLSILALILGLLGAPYFYFQLRINEAFFIDTSATPAPATLLRHIKFGIYALFPASLLFTILLLRGKFRTIGLVVFTIIYASVLLTLTNFYDYFGSVPHWNQIGGLTAIRQLGIQFSSQLMGIEDAFQLVFIVLGVLIAAFFSKQWPAQKTKWLPVAIGALPLLLLGLQLIRYPFLSMLNSHGYTRACSHFGILPTYTVMLKDFFPTTFREVPIPDALAQRSPSPAFAKAAGSNIICLQVESLDASLIGKKIGGIPITPFLNELAAANPYFPQCVAMHAGGGSSDAELAALTSLLPLKSGSGFRSAHWEKMTSLSEILKEHGYSNLAFHSNQKSFYNRHTRYQKLKFDAFHDSSSFTGEASGWYSQDEAFFEQSFDFIQGADSPFFAYLITLQSHGPFENYQSKTRSIFGEALEQLSALEADYVCSFREVDSAIAQFFTQLSATGRLDSSVVFIYGDHESGVYEIEDRIGSGERVPLIVCSAKLQEITTPDQVVSHVDIAPTILDLLGIEAPDSWIGSSVFLNPEERPPVVLSNGNVIAKDSATDKNVGREIIDYSRAMLGR